MTKQDAQSLARWLGFLMLAGIITMIPAIVVVIIIGGVASAVTDFMFLRMLFGIILVGIGAIGLVLHRRFSFYLIYLATILSFWTTLVPYLPIPQKWLPFAESNVLVVPALNAIAIILLGCAHMTLLPDSSPAKGRWRGFAWTGLIALALVTFIGWRLQYSLQSGRADSPADLPLVGKSLAGLKTVGPLQFRSQFTRWNHSLILVFSGNTSADELAAFTATNQLTQFTHDEDRKFLGMAKKWQLNAKVFPTDFAAGDLYYSGRLTGYKKAIFQICLNKLSGDFTAQVFGEIAPP